MSDNFLGYTRLEETKKASHPQESSLRDRKEEDNK